ncbi:hypothetical protein DIPPA_19962 [Diplonema papillatum]|nr:hypothetical protein DIPPA_19962 [Diplonema papillatum]
MAPGDWIKHLPQLAKKRVLTKRNLPTASLTRYLADEKLAPRRDDFWTWGTLHIDKVSVLAALLNRMLPRRYHKWYENTAYTHEWVAPGDSEDGETTELFILARVRGASVPSVLKFRMKPAENPGKDDIKVIIDYHRVRTDHGHQWSVWVARDATCRLIQEMDDWYKEMTQREVALLGDDTVSDKVKCLPAAVAPGDAKAKHRFQRYSGVAAKTTTAPVTSAEAAQQAEWGYGLTREERPLPSQSMYDPRKWDLEPIKQPAWPIPRIDGQLAWQRDKSSTANSHR